MGAVEQALNLFMEWGVLGDEASWKQPVSSWFELWWKQSVWWQDHRYAHGNPPEKLLQEAAKVEHGLEHDHDEAYEKPRLNLALSAAPAACGRAPASFPSSNREELEPLVHNVDQRSAQQYD